MESLKIIGFSVLAAITYGILHDQVTAHLCVEYFTIAHPQVFPTQSPFLLALGWGTIATWWVGLPLGVGLALAARTGDPQTRQSLGELLPPIGVLLSFMAVCALIAGVVGAYLVATHRAAVPGGWDAVIPPAKWVAFSADAWAHLASYGSGVVGGLLVISYVAVGRWRAR
jgi:hypothetical protein